MPQGVLRRTGPASLSATYTTNIFNPSSALIFAAVKEIHVENRTGTAATFRMYVGATGGNVSGTEIAPIDKNVPANDEVVLRFYPGLKMLSTDFLVGGASAGSTLVCTIIYEDFVV